MYCATMSLHYLVEIIHRGLLCNVTTIKLLPITFEHVLTRPQISRLIISTCPDEVANIGIFIFEYALTTLRHCRNMNTSSGSELLTTYSDFYWGMIVILVNSLGYKFNDFGKCVDPYFCYFGGVWYCVNINYSLATFAKRANYLDFTQDSVVIEAI